jgi:hypothetical protein
MQSGIWPCTPHHREKKCSADPKEMPWSNHGCNSVRRRRAHTTTSSSREADVFNLCLVSTKSPAPPPLILSRKTGQLASYRRPLVRTTSCSRVKLFGVHELAWKKHLFQFKWCKRCIGIGSSSRHDLSLPSLVHPWDGIKATNKFSETFRQTHTKGTYGFRQIDGIRYVRPGKYLSRGRVQKIHVFFFDCLLGSSAQRCAFLRLFLLIIICVDDPTRRSRSQPI